MREVTAQSISLFGVSGKASIEASASTSEPAPLLSAPAPLPGKTPTIRATEPGLIPNIGPTGEPAGVDTEGSMDGRDVDAGDRLERGFGGAHGGG